jgi:hypothetical protein
LPGQSEPPSPGEGEPLKKSILFVKNQRSFFVKKTMANKQIDMRKVKQIFKRYSTGVRKPQISSRLGDYRAIPLPSIFPFLSGISLPGMKYRR